MIPPSLYSSASTESRSNHTTRLEYLPDCESSSANGPCSEMNRIGKITFRRMWHRSQLYLRLSFTACWRAISGERIALHRIGFPAILSRRVPSDVGDKQRTSINDVERDRHAQPTLVWIEAPECSYRDMRKGACQKREDYAS